jgi:hypothetical protein
LSFRASEKGRANLMYRWFVDGMLRRRHRLADFLFDLQPLKPADRLQRIFSLARQFAVEVETHPINAEEYRFLTGGDIFRSTRGVPIAPGFALPICQRAGKKEGRGSNGNT